jgi:magnesium-transporting ATPase (P-type)
MAKWERVVAILCFVYVVGYSIYFFTFVWAGAAEESVFMPFHLLGMALSFTLVVLVVRDIYRRQFVNPNAKVTWALLVLFLFPLIPIYLWKYGFKPRELSAGNEVAGAV